MLLSATASLVPEVLCPLMPRFCGVSMHVLLTCMSTYHMSVLCPWRPEEATWYSGTGVTGGCESPCGFWELDPGPLKEQSLSVSILSQESSGYLVVLSCESFLHLLISGNLTSCE